MNLRQELGDLLADLLITFMETGHGPRFLSASPEGGDPSAVTCDGIHEQHCTIRNFECPNEQDESSFTCASAPGQQNFTCASDEIFDCNAETFECSGNFHCNYAGNFNCDSDVFTCNSVQIDGGAKFECKHGEGTDFDCTNTTGHLYDFNCDREGQLGQLGFGCPSTDEQFECDGLHVFRCWSRFSCPESHTCRPPRTSCPPEEGQWGPPPGEDDDGSAGDFDCFNFQCDGDTQHPEQKFDCQAGSQFKCLDGETEFDCGANSNFECGQEGEEFVCHDYTCANNFRCEANFTCGSEGEPYACGIFTCLAVAEWMPGQTSFDCGGGEDSFRCNSESSFSCTNFACSQTYSP